LGICIGDEMENLESPHTPEIMISASAAGVPRGKISEYLKQSLASDLSAEREVVSR
jgi:hypothetical protein